MAATIGGTILAERSSSSYLCFSKRLFSYSSSIAKALSFYGFVRSIGSTSLVSHSIRFAAPTAIRFNQIRCFSKWPPMDFHSLILCWDQEHWHIIMKKPGDEDVTKQEMIDCYIQTLAKVLGSEEEAKKKMRNNFGFGFGCEVNKETAKKLEGV
ncbi:multiple organellar RNA editing factor 6, mitochondrial-like [Cornus florida]|uniref:multiple organellar RNA editing factor 6, mitochondrial-like n=1 Tax=Cornus florida TaxID=4283 RepID=UPI00289EAF0A|nr:multiple organellar RNA editing factor 6, mitochondrial-like [Cornus florida]